MGKDNNSKTSKQNGAAKRKQWWRRRSKLERKLIVSLVIAVLLLVGVITYVTVKYTETLIPCTTPACLVAASQIVRHIDPTIDPCDDFFKFACGKFIEHAHGDLKAASIIELEQQIERQVSEIIQEPINEDDHYMVKNQKEMFQGCMNETAVGEESLARFKEVFEEIHGWPVLVGHAWKYKRFNWIDFTYKLRRLGYPYSMLLKVEAMPDFVDEKKYSVYINEPFVKKIKNDRKDAYKNYMTEVAAKFGAKRDHAELEMENVLDFMERLRKITESFDVDNGNETERNITAEILSRRYTVDEFQNQNNQIDWLDFINNILYPVANISSSDYVVFPESEFIEEFFKLMYKTPKKIQANYMIWTVLEAVMPLLPEEFKQLRENYECQAESSMFSKERFQFCKTVIGASFHPSPTSIIYARNYLPAEKKELVREMLHNIKSEFVVLLGDTTWLDEESREKAIEKANSMSEFIGVPGDYLDDAIFEIFEPTKSINENDTFFNMFLNNRRHRTDVKFSRINKPINDSELEIFYHFLTKVNAMYSPDDNALMLPVGILQGIFFNPDRPNYLNYGGLGSIMGHELTHGFAKDASKFDKDGNEGNMWTNATARAYEEKTKCVIHAAENFDIEDSENSINGTLTLEENIADFTGIKVAYAAYKTWVRGHGEEPALTGINHTPYQLFWISAILHECYELSGEKLEKSLEYDSHALNSFRATGPMRNNPDFAKDFNCPADSKMNPSEKCQVF